MFIPHPLICHLLPRKSIVSVFWLMMRIFHIFFCCCSYSLSCALKLARRIEFGSYFLFIVPCAVVDPFKVRHISVPMFYPHTPIFFIVVVTKHTKKGQMKGFDTLFKFAYLIHINKYIYYFFV